MAKQIVCAHCRLCMRRCSNYIVRTAKKVTSIAFHNLREFGPNSRHHPLRGFRPPPELCCRRSRAPTLSIDGRKPTSMWARRAKCWFGPQLRFFCNTSNGILLVLLYFSTPLMKYCDFVSGNQKFHVDAKKTSKYLYVFTIFEPAHQTLRFPLVLLLFSSRHQNHLQNRKDIDNSVFLQFLNSRKHIFSNIS